MKLELKRDKTDSCLELKFFYREKIKCIFITVTAYYLDGGGGIFVETYQGTKIIKPWCLFILYQA